MKKSQYGTFAYAYICLVWVFICGSRQAVVVAWFCSAPLLVAHCHVWGAALDPWDTSYLPNIRVYMDTVIFTVDS